MKLELNLVLDRVTVVGKMRRFKRIDKVGDREISRIDSRVIQMLKGEKDFLGNELITEKLFIEWLHDKRPIGQHTDYNFMYHSIWLKIRDGVDLDKKSPYDHWYRVGDHVYIQVSHKNKGNDIRIDFNPAKLEQDEEWFVNDLLIYIREKEFTRIDLALDFLKKNFCLGWKLVDAKNRKVGGYWNGRGELETMYRGTKNSLVEVKFYDKGRETTKKMKLDLNKLVREAKEKIKKDAENGIESELFFDEDLRDQILDDISSSDWWRIEETIRKDKAKRWKEHIWFEGLEIRRVSEFNGIESIKMPKEISANDEASIIACLVKPELIKRFGKEKQSKIRKYLESLTYDDEEEVFRPSELLNEVGFAWIEIKKKLEKMVETKTDLGLIEVVGPDDDEMIEIPIFENGDQTIEVSKKWVDKSKVKSIEGKEEKVKEDRKKVGAFELDEEATKKYFPDYEPIYVERVEVEKQKRDKKEHLTEESNQMSLGLGDVLPNVPDGSKL